MGIKIIKGADFDIQLVKIAERSTRQLRRVHRDGAHKMAEVAQDMAPYKKGELEDSISVEEVEGVFNRKEFHVTVDAPHAVYMHEGVYSLGPGSEAKDGASPYKVGRKFMDRAADWLVQDWGLYKRLRSELRKAKK